MTKKKAALLGVVVGLVALVAWLVTDGYAEEVPPVASASPPVERAPAPGFVTAAPSTGPENDELVQRPGRSGQAGAPAVDGGAAGVDANEPSELLRAFNDGSIRGELERNGKRAAEEIDRFCDSASAAGRGAVSCRVRAEQSRGNSPRVWFSP